MIIDTLDKFVAAVPTADKTEFTAIKPYLEEADADVIESIIGIDLYNYVSNLSDDDRIKITLRNLIACDAYARAIPFADLIQTPNGFAVVNNSNMAPASKERVERLIAQCHRTVDICTDLIIIQVLSIPQARTEWVKFQGFNSLTDCLILTGKDWSNFSGQLNSGRRDFIKIKPLLLDYQKTIIEPAISKDYVAALITKIRTGTLSATVDCEVVNACKLILSALFNKRNDEAKMYLDKLIYSIESKIDDFPVYKASVEYALRTSANYENKMDDPTFFFAI